MGFWDNLFGGFGGQGRPAGVDLANCPAVAIMRRLNANALIAFEDGYVVAIEDHFDSDQDRRMYRLEYRSSPDGRRAIAFCLYNPWAPGGPPNGGYSYATCHVSERGLICLGPGHPSTVSESSFDLQTAVLRSRYWTVAYSVLRETGTFPNP